MRSTDLANAISNCMNQYNKAGLEIESRFEGWPHVHTTLIKSLISRISLLKELIEKISYRKLCALLAIDHPYGRKITNILKKETLHHYLCATTEVSELTNQGHAVDKIAHLRALVCPQ